MNMNKGSLRVVPIKSVVIHRFARDLFRFSKGLEPQCEVSALCNGSTGTYSPIIPWAIKIKSEYHVFSHWHGILHSNEQNLKIPIVTFKDLTDSEIRWQARSFIVQLLSIQFHKSTYHGQLAELAERYPEIKGLFFSEGRHSTSKSFAYKYGQIDRKSVQRQCARLSKRFNPNSGGRDD